MAKKGNFITNDLDWAQQQLEQWKKYVDDHPYGKLKDRIVGGKLVSNIETQMAAIRKTLEDYLKLLPIVNELREKDDKKKDQVRGDKDLSPLEEGEI